MENEKDEPMINLKKREGQLLRMVEKVMDQPGAERTRREKPLALLDTDRI